MPDKVVITAYSALGKLLCEQFFSIGDYYDTDISLLDKDEARRFYKVAMIAVKFVPPSESFADAEMLYDDSGLLIETRSVNHANVNMP